MVKVGDTVKWSAGKQGMLSGKVTGGEKGKRWRIESKGKRYYVPKEDVKKGVVKKEKAPAPKKGKVFVKKNGGSGRDFATIKEATDDIQKTFRSNDFRNLRIYDSMEKAHDEGREVGFKVKFMMRAEKSKREEAGKDKPSDDNVTVTPYYTNADGSTTDTRKTIAKVMDTRKYKVDPSLFKERKSDLKLKS
jgi:hypothetical protein